MSKEVELTTAERATMACAFSFLQRKYFHRFRAVERDCLAAPLLHPQDTWIFRQGRGKKKPPKNFFGGFFITKNPCSNEHGASFSF